MANPFPAAETWLPGFAASSPLYEPLGEAARALESLECWPGLDDFNALLAPSVKTASGHPLQFVSQIGKPVPMAEKYEARIYLSGEVQTRLENWHDFFNALVWLVFPRSKAALNARHFEAISLTAAGGNRDRSRDALTLFDESGVAVLYSDESLADLIRGFRWKELFWERRQRVSSGMRFMVFGHSLHEKALQPYIGLTGKALLLKVDEGFFDQPLAAQTCQADEMIASEFTSKPSPFTIAPSPSGGGLGRGKEGRGEGNDRGESPHQNMKPRVATPVSLTPLPLLGVPGWWAGNASPDFYGNAAYFRPAPTAGAANH